MDPGLIISIIAILTVIVIAWREFDVSEDIERLHRRRRHDESRR